MPFPTTSVLTDFTGTLETPISEDGTWVSTGTALIGAASPNRNGSGGMSLNANWEIRRVETTGPQREIYATLSAVAANFVHLWMLAGSDYYRLDIDGSSVWRFYKTADSQIGGDLATQALGAGDAIGFEYVGGILRAYRKPSGGSWGQIGTDRSDSLLASATGYLAASADTNFIFDDFGGGTVGGLCIGDSLMLYSKF